VNPDMFSNILVAYDGSEQSKQALQKAIQFAELSAETAIEVILVYQLQQYIVGESLIAFPPSLEAEQYQYAESQLEEAKKQIEHLPNAETTIVQGFASRAILEHAKTKNKDLIIIGSRGLGGFKELVLGGVSSSVIQHATVPVLVIK